MTLLLRTRQYVALLTCLLATSLAPGAARAAYVDAILADSPTGYWRFEETMGSQANDSSGNLQHGTYDNVSLGAAGAASIGGNSASFSHLVNSGVNLPGTWGGAISYPQLTIEAWVNVAGATTDFQAIVSSDTTNEFAHFQMHPAGGTGPYTNTNFVNLTAPTISPTGQWRHLALVAESGNTRLYENGVQTSAAATVFDNILAGDNVDIGRGFGGARNFNGLIDEVAIYNTALSQAQVRNHINAATDGLLGHYTFDVDGTDSSFQAHHGTLGGGATITSDARKGAGALDLRGVDGFVDVVDPILSGHDQYTVAMWLNADNLPGSVARLMTNDGFSSGEIHVNLNSAGQAENAVAGSFPNYAQAGPLTEDEWVHLAFAYDSISGMTTPYINGIAQSPTAHLTGVLAGVGGTTFGAWDTDGLGNYIQFFDGRIDDVRVYGRLLSDLEVLRLVTGVPEPSTVVLVALGGCFAGVGRCRKRY